MGAGAAVYVSTVTVYLASHVLELVGNTADNNKTRFVPRHLLVIRWCVAEHPGCFTSKEHRKEMRFIRKQINTNGPF